MRFSVLILWIAFGGFVLGQAPHEHPDHPKGNNSNDQYAALPFYNEACELYAKGELERAKRSLKEAINTSFALTEAQLFLATIYYQENKLDSACLYLNSGIDFAPEAKAHFYFMFFQTALKLEQYHYAQHWLKSFKKLFGHVISGKYEEEYSFTVDDFERIENSLNMIYNYKYWVPKSHEIDTLNTGKINGLATIDNDVITYSSAGGKILKSKKQFKKSKRLKYDVKNAVSVSVSKENHYLFLSKRDAEDVNIYFAKKQGKRWGDLVKIEGAINSTFWDSDPFFYEEKSLIYFSSDRGGNKDIYVAKFDPETGKSGEAINVERINTPYDEVNPKFIDSTFYFSSNGLPGFGGFDLYYTDQWWMENDIVQPSDWFNMGKPYNSGSDETEIYFLTNREHLVHQTDWKGQELYRRMRYLSEQPVVNMDIRLIEFKEEVD
jgi:tetratricopeptide (TPR) repeat protein